MILEEMLKEEYEAGEAEGREKGRIQGKAEGKMESAVEFLLELLEDMGTVPEELREKIATTSDLEVLRKWHRQVIKAESIEQFMREMQ